MIVQGSVTCLEAGGFRRFAGFPRSQSEVDGDGEARPRVLVVDDEKLLADTTTTILHHAGYNAKTAYDGMGALEMARSFRPDYLLTDIMMPAMNGIELAIAVTKMYPGTKVLLVSGQAGISTILDESRAKGFEFPLLAKPVHPERLIEELRVLKTTPLS